MPKATVNLFQQSLESGKHSSYRTDRSFLRNVRFDDGRARAQEREQFFQSFGNFTYLSVARSVFSTAEDFFYAMEPERHERNVIPDRISEPLFDKSVQFIAGFALPDKFVTYAETASGDVQSVLFVHSGYEFENLFS